MKKLALVLAMVMMFLFVSTACADELVGGWTVPETTEVTEDAQAALDKALEDFVGSNVEAVALLGTQVVAGTNYCLLCKVTPVVPDAVAHYSIVYIYAALDGSASFLTFVDLDVGALLEASLLDEAE